MELREWGRSLARMRKPRYSNASEFADAVGVTKRTIEAWEAGEHWPKALHMAQLVRVLGPEIDPGAVGQLNRIEAKLDSVQSAVDSLVVRMVDVTRALGDVGRGDAQ